MTAQMEAGAGTIIDVRGAEVALGQAQVTALTTHNQSLVDKLRLFQTMGVPADTSIELTTTFAVARPSFSLDSVLDIVPEKAEADAELVQWIEEQIAARREARIRRDFAESDRIRDELKSRGVVLEDSAGETRWKIE